MKPVSNDHFHATVYTQHIQVINSNLNKLISFHLKKILRSFKVFLSYMKFLKERATEIGHSKDSHAKDSGGRDSQIISSLETVIDSNRQLKVHLDNYNALLMETRKLFFSLQKTMHENRWVSLMGEPSSLIEGASLIEPIGQHKSRLTYNDLVQSNEQLFQDLLSIWDLIHLIYTSMNEREAVWVYNTWWIVLKRAQQIFVDANRKEQKQTLVNWEKEMIASGFVVV
uniref:Uncharacterized protein n=1 Tax=Percolomonas cosmopolitus TaxID=63605 RepID=A0A7S1KST0_9EUKA